MHVEAHKEGAKMRNTIKLTTVTARELVQSEHSDQWTCKDLFIELLWINLFAKNRETKKKIKQNYEP